MGVENYSDEEDLDLGLALEFDEETGEWYDPVYKNRDKIVGGTTSSLEIGLSSDSDQRTFIDQQSEAAVVEGQVKETGDSFLDEHSEEVVAEGSVQEKIQTAKLISKHLLNEKRWRDKQMLAPYIAKTLQVEPLSDENTREEDLGRAQCEAVSATLQVASQISEARFKQRPDALKRRVLEDESESLGRLDKSLGEGFFLAKEMIKEGKGAEVAAEARKVIAKDRKTTPEKVTAGDETVLKWVEQKIQRAGRRIRKHRKQAHQLLYGR